MEAVILLGAPGSGKGTVAEDLKASVRFEHVSTGDKLRDAVKAGSAVGLEAKAYMERGELVPDEVIIKIMDEVLRTGSPDARYMFDGFPRTVPQGRSLQEITAVRPLDAVVDLEVPEDVVLERITKRRVCTTCGRIYSVDAPPATPWVCDTDGGDVVQRADDTEEAVRKRLDLYAAETKPLVPFFEELGLLVVVDGLGSPDDVYARLRAAVDARLG